MKNGSDSFCYNNENRVKIVDFKIYCNSGSAAEDYAIKKHKDQKEAMIGGNYENGTWIQ